MSQVSAQIVHEGKAVLITFPSSSNTDASASESSLFHAEWLWFNQSSNVLPGAGQRIQSSGSYYNKTPDTISQARIISNHELNYPIPSSFFPLRTDSVHPIEVETVQDFKMDNLLLLEIVWEPLDDVGVETKQWTTTSYYHIPWLEQWRYDTLALRRRRTRAEVTPAHTFIHKWRTGSYSDRKEEYKGLLDFDYNDIILQSSQNSCDNELLFHLMETVFIDGALIVRNTPVEQGDAPLTNIAKVLGGYLSHGTLYGDTFQVRSEPHAINVAYTSQPLAPHQDLVYYESKPGLQLLHCIQTMSGDTGGESTLVDGLAAAYRFRQLTPQYFHDLTTCNATFVKQRRGAHMTYCRPHIVLKAEDASSDVDREIVSIHWAPPFEGPLLISPEKISSYYRAYAAFELLVDDTKSYMHTSQLNHELSLYAKEYTWQYRLQPGEMLIFNNARMLHGRRGFQTDESCTRLLIGGYTGMDDTLNRFRLLLNGRKMETYPNIGNGTTSFIP